MDIRTQTQSDNRTLNNITLDVIDPSPYYPFNIKNDEEMNDLTKSIEMYGMLTPGVVRQKEGGRYELVSGHRRFKACQMTGKKAFTCEIMELTDDEAVAYMLESNRQRLKICLTEKSNIYNLKLNQAGDPDIEIEVSDIRILRMDSKDTIKTIKKLLNLVNLIPELKEMLDEDELSLLPAYELSYLPENLQKIVMEKMLSEVCKPSHAQTIRMKRLNENNLLDENVIGEMMRELKPNQKERFSIREEYIKDLFPVDMSVKRKREYLIKALEFFREHRREKWRDI